MKKLVSSLFILSIFGIIPSFVYADQANQIAEIRKQFPITGKVHSVDAKNRTIVINDISHKLSVNVIVYDSNGYTSDVRSLRIGQEIAYKLQSVAGETVIPEIRILPITNK